MDTAAPTIASLDMPAIRHPMLRPGVRITRRDDRSLQVGLDRRSSLVVPDNPQVRAMLEALRSGGPIDGGHENNDVWRMLESKGQLVDADTYFHQLPQEPAAQRSRAALFAQHPRDAGLRVIARAAARVAVDADHGEGAVTELLGRAGVGAGTSRPTVALVIADGEVRRRRLDRFLQAGTPHLLVSHGEGRVLVGPFVDPGRTACLRCLDAHLGEADPRRNLIVEQYADPPTPTAVADPLDETFTSLAVSLAVADVIAFVDGDRPASWSTTIEVGPGLDLPRTLWKRHPRCGCSWGENVLNPRTG